jgi:N-acetylneuraminate synthase
MMPNDSVLIIAEAGVNHNGSMDMAKKLIDAAVFAGADVVKFQTFKADSLVTQTAPKAQYQKDNDGVNDTQLQMLKKLELSEADHKQLIQYCQEKEITFLSSPFDGDSVRLLHEKFRLPLIKIPSGEITNGPLLLSIAKTNTKVILSTGMSTIDEVKMALAVLAFAYCGVAGVPSPEKCLNFYDTPEAQAVLKEKVSLLHCVSQYPAPFDEVNLRSMDLLRSTFDLPVGFSDHTQGIAIPIAAVARGATIIEKHFTLSHELPGPDHLASLEPHELVEMVSSIRQVSLALGQAVKQPSASELNNRSIVRKSIVATKTIQAGDVFSEDNIGIKRPGVGLSPMCFWGIIGTKATKDYQVDMEIEL